MSDNSLASFEEVIGYTFKNKKFLKIALTHKSYIDEHPTYESNQRYEFLGDAILDFDLTNYLFNKYPDLEEGSLTKIRSSAVNQAALVSLGHKISIGTYLYLSKPEESTGGRMKDSIVEDAVEALIAALFFDGGLDTVNDFVSKYIYPNIKELSEDPGSKDYKTRLQEFYAKQGKKVTYVDNSAGPDHNKQFVSDVILENNVIGTGKGKSKKSAQQHAAKQALDKVS
jgi:ribonuclease-3